MAGGNKFVVRRRQGRARCSADETYFPKVTGYSFLNFTFFRCSIITRRPFDRVRMVFHDPVIHPCAKDGIKRQILWISAERRGKVKVQVLL